MIKNNFNLTEELKKEYLKELYSSRFDKKNGLTVKERFEEYKKGYPFNVIFYDKSFEDIVLIKPEKITCLISQMEKRIIENSTIKVKNKKDKRVLIYEIKDKIKEVFKYDKFQSECITPFFTQKLDVSTCYYCNKDFILNFNAPKKTSTFQLDHFYDKGKYPYLALSFYNLIPSCATCNSSKVKGSKDCFKHDSRVGKFENETCKIPNHKDFDFDRKVKFKLLLTKSCKDLNIKTKENIDIQLKERYSNEYKKYIEVFKLNERYQAHKDIVFEMIKNAELYPESRLKELQDLTGIPYQEIKKDIFKLISDEVDLSKEPFSKLKRDMAHELGLLK